MEALLLDWWTWFQRQLSVRATVIRWTHKAVAFALLASSASSPGCSSSDRRDNPAACCDMDSSPGEMGPGEDHGAGCVSECEQGLFCDRGTCVPVQNAYGRECMDGLFPVQGLKESRLYICAAYVCENSRCQSCTSDEECMEKLGAPRCSEEPGFPGRSCGL